MSWRIAAALGCAVIYAVLRQQGLLNLLLVLGLLGLAALELGGALVALVRRRVTRSAWQTHTFWLRAGSSALLAAMLAWAVLVSTFVNDIPPDERTSFPTQVVLVAALIVGACLVPRASRSGPLPLARLTLVAALALELAWSARPLGPAVELSLPFARPALVVHGGASPLTNHHALVASQAHAADLLSSGRRGPDDCQGEPLLAPASGRVTSVVKNLPDSPVRPDFEHPAGNHVVIALGPGGPYVLLAHLEQDSIDVRVGAQVERGQVLGRCGNSGNSSQPHLHLQAQNQPRLDERSRELRTFPIRFIDVSRTRRGSVTRGALEARRNDVLAPLQKPR